jgi:hypothetical protein
MTSTGKQVQKTLTARRSLQTGCVGASLSLAIFCADSPPWPLYHLQCHDGRPAIALEIQDTAPHGLREASQAGSELGLRPFSSGPPGSRRGAHFRCNQTRIVKNTPPTTYPPSTSLGQ